MPSHRSPSPTRRARSPQHPHQPRQQRGEPHLPTHHLTIRQRPVCGERQQRHAGRVCDEPNAAPTPVAGDLPCRGGNATHAPEPPTPPTAAPRGDGSPAGKLGTRGSLSCNRHPHTTLRVAARWPPLPVPEASGCALLVTTTSMRARTRPNAATAETPPTRAPGRAARAGLPRRGHPVAPVVPQACWRSGSSGRARSAKSRPG